MPYQATRATQATRVRRQRALLHAATAVVTAHGFRLATVKSVAAAAGMSVGSVYLFFPTKAELLAAVFRQAAEVELAAVRTAVHDARTASAQTGAGSDAAAPGQTAAAELTALVRSFAHRAITGRRLAWALLLEPVDRAIDLERLEYRRLYANLVADILGRGIRSGELAPQNPELSGGAIVGAISEALIGQLSPWHSDIPQSTESDSTDEVIAAINALCLRAVGAPAPAAVLTGRKSP